jgi:predicted nucleotidyltransferase
VQAHPIHRQVYGGLAGIPSPALAEVCRRYGVRRLLLFGSFARGEADEESDLDLLVEFFPGRTPGLGFVRLQEELTRLFGRRVDLHTPGSLSPYLREEILKEARPIHEAA